MSSATDDRSSEDHGPSPRAAADSPCSRGQLERPSVARGTDRDLSSVRFLARVRPGGVLHPIATVDGVPMRPPVDAWSKARALLADADAAEPPDAPPGPRVARRG